MSGNSVGWILMGVAAIIVAPYVVAGTAAVAVAYGAVKIGQGLVKHYAKARKRKKLEMKKASKDVAKTYDDMEKSIEKMESRKARNARAAARKLDDSARELKSRQKCIKDTKEINQLLTEKKTEFKKIVKEEIHDKDKEILTDAKKEMEDNIKRLQAEKKTLANQLNTMNLWKKNDSETLKKQNALTETEWNDARETIKLLESLSQEQRFADKNDALELLKKQFKKTEDMYKKGLYEASFAGFQNVVVKGANLVKQNALEYQERTAIQAELEARIEGLIEEVDKRRELMVTNEKDGKVYYEDLNDYCNDGFVKLADALKKYQDNIEKNGSQMTAYQMEKALLQVDACMVPKVEELMESAIQSMQTYYKKLQVLGIVTEFMEEQGYDTEWVQSEGDDRCRKLVVNFTHKDNGNAVSFTIDMEQDGEEMSRMLMDMMIFYEEREVTEFEKKKLREHINQVLQDNGIKGGLSCAGDVGKSSSRVEYKDREKVRNMA